MNPARSMTSWLSAALLLLSSSVLAENSRDFGEYVVHYNSLATDMLHPQISRQYHITRSKHRGMINITVLKKVLGSPGQPVHANVTATARNLAGQERKIRMREIRDGTAIYYIGEFGVAHEETLKFTVRAVPRAETSYLEVEFSQDFYTD